MWCCRSSRASGRTAAQLFTQTRPFSIHPPALGVREAQEYGGTMTQSSKPAALRLQQVGSDYLFGLKSGFPVACQRPCMDSYSLNLNPVLYYRKEAKASHRVSLLASTQVTSFLSSSMPSVCTELRPARKKAAYRWQQLGRDASQVLKPVLDTVTIRMPRYPGSPSLLHCWFTAKASFLPFFYCIEQQENGRNYRLVQ